ncbi:MAG: hypothetical protein KDD61_02075 [Bdellovibrionales bacterium]|nr:hypothetical protein [Bdellovibrionales bacterium]
MKILRIFNLNFVPILLIFAITSCSKNQDAVNGSSNGKDGGLLNNGVVGPSFDLYFGVSESTNNRSYLKKFYFNSNTNAVSDSLFVQLSYNSELRGLDLDENGRVVVANAQLSNPIEIIDISSTDSLSIYGNISPSLGTNSGFDTNRNHTICVLPNGNKVIGGYNPGNTVYINEYSSGGEFIQNIHSSNHISFNISMNKCVSRSNLELYLIEANSSVGGGAKLLRFTRSNISSSWSLIDSLLDSDFDGLNGASGSSFWSFAIDVENSYIYLSRYMDTGTQFKKLVRCPVTGFNASNCVGIGDDIPSDSRVKSMIVIPGTSGDLLVFTFLPGHTLYRFNVSDGTWTSLFDLTTMNLGSDSYGQVWAKSILN